MLLAEMRLLERKPPFYLSSIPPLRSVDVKKVTYPPLHNLKLHLVFRLPFQRLWVHQPQTTPPIFGLCLIDRYQNECPDNLGALS